MHTLTVRETSPNTLHAQNEAVTFTLIGTEATLTTPSGTQRFTVHPQDATDLLALPCGARLSL